MTPSGACPLFMLCEYYTTFPEKGLSKRVCIFGSPTRGKSAENAIAL